MDRTDFVLAVLAASNGEAHTPVQVQKIFFLIDRNIANQIGGPQFNFQPFNYGPFDHQVYQEVERLQRRGDVAIGRNWNDRMNMYQTTYAGQQKGLQLLDKLSPEARDYVHRASDWARGQSFTSLVSSIYNAYPEMRANSVFQG
jgi:uncharacterized protein